jgi:hypothetical protein
MPSALPIQTLVETIHQTLSRDHQTSSTDGPAIANSHQLLVLTTHAILSSSSFYLDTKGNLILLPVINY